MVHNEEIAVETCSSCNWRCMVVARESHIVVAPVCREAVHECGLMAVIAKIVGVGCRQEWEQVMRDGGLSWGREKLAGVPADYQVS
jgi:hypothetical protein